MNRFANGSPMTNRIGAIVVAGVANVVIILIARGILGRWPHAEVNGDMQVIMVGEVIAATVTAGVLAWVVAWLLGRFVDRPARTWLIVSVVVWVVSLLSLTGAQNASSAIALGILHTVTAAILIPGFARTLPERRA